MNKQEKQRIDKETVKNLTKELKQTGALGDSKRKPKEPRKKG